VPSRREAWDGSTSETICRVPRLARTVDVYRQQIAYRDSIVHTTVPTTPAATGPCPAMVSGGPSLRVMVRCAACGDRIANLSFDCVKTSKLLVFHTNDLYLRIKSASGIPGIHRAERAGSPLALADCGQRRTLVALRAPPPSKRDPISHGAARQRQQVPYERRAPATQNAAAIGVDRPKIVFDRLAIKPRA